MNTQDFLQASAAGDLDALQQLLAAEPALLQVRGATGQSPVLAAIYHGKPQVVAYLLEQGIELDVFEASAVGKLERVQELVASDSQLASAFGSDGFTPLGLAAFLGHHAVVAYLLEQGAEANVASKNAFRVMPLHSAVANRHLAIAELLLARGADVNAKQEGGFTPLHEAALQGNDEMIQLLLAHGADVTAQKEDGETPLDTAKSKQQEHVLHLLG